MNKNNKIISRLVDISSSKTAMNTMRSVFSSQISFTRNSRNNQNIPKKVVSMKRFSFKSLGFLLSLLLTGVNANASSVELHWNSFPANGSTANSGTNFGNVQAHAHYTSWGLCGENSEMWASGSCWFNGNGTTYVSEGGGCFDSAESNASVQMKPGDAAGALTECVVRLRATYDGGTVDETRRLKVRQIVTLNNPGPRDDVDPDYTIYASAKTADGKASTLNTTNKLSFVSSTPTKCIIVSTDINSAVVRHMPGISGTCSVTAYAAGDSSIPAADSGLVSWQIVNTQFPQLALVTSLTKGLKPSFVFSSTQASMPGTLIEVLGDCNVGGASSKAAILGNNTFRLGQLTLGATYSTCQIKVTNEIGPGYLNIPPFTVVENLDGPGGIGGTDGATPLMLWLNGNNLADSGTIATWVDQSGRDNDFASSGGGIGTIGDPFTSIQNARDRMTVAGIYYFNLAGNTFSTQVDSNGYVLVASAKGSTNGTYTTTTNLTFQADKVLTAAILANLDINEVRMNVTEGANAGFNVTSTNATIISELKANSQFPNEDDFGNVTVWSGDTGFLISSCGSSGGHARALTNSIYHACGNANGMHWIPQDSVEKVTNSGTNTNLNLWVRAASLVGLQPSISTLNGFKTAYFDGGTKYLKRTNTNLNARSVFVVYNDVSTAGWVTPLTTDAFTGANDGLIHGAGTDAGLHDATYTPGPVLNGSNWANGVNQGNMTTTPRPDNAQVISRIFTSNFNNVSTNWWFGSDRGIATRSLTGAVAETMVFSSALNEAQRVIIENYLAAKYNLTLSTPVIGQVYTYGGNPTFGGDSFKYDMAGIGKASDNSTHINAKGSLVQIFNPVGMGTNEYVMWGHDNAPVTFQNTDVPALISQRLNRVWRVRNSGIDSMDVTFHVNEIPGFLSMCFDPNTLRLLVDGDGNFNAGATIKSGVYDSSAKTVTFTNVAIANSNYISFGVGGSPSNIYVTVKGAGSKNGTDWANACTLQAALGSPRVTGDTVKLAQGLYKPTSTIYINSGITIIGGFEGLLTSEVSSPETYTTVISGDKDNDDEALGSIIMYHRDINGSNLSRLFNIVNLPNAVTLEGFYITGMSQFSNHGSAVWQQNSTVNYKKIKFFGNRAREMGGALLVYNGATANISDSIFLGNAAEAGGAINAHVTATVNITNTQFINNDSILLNNRSNPAAPVSVSKGLAFNGGTNKVTTDLTKSPTNNFTYEAWVKSDNAIHEIDPQNNTGAGGVSGQNYVFGAWSGRDGNCASVASGAGLSVGTNGVSVYEHAGCYMPALAVYSGSGVIGTGWNHIAVVYNNRTPSIYVNGVLRVTGVQSAKATVYAPFEIGSGTYGGFAGEIDEVRIWNDVRTQAEIAGNMYREISDPTADASLVGYWKFNDNALGSTAVANNGTLSTPQPLYVNGTVPSENGSGGGAAWNRFAGGAIDANSGSAVNITGSSFIGNNAQNVNYTLGIQGIGGAISLTQNAASSAAANNASLTVTNTSFSYNSSRDGGGAIYAMSGFNTINITNSQFLTNSTTRPVGTYYWGSGGAIYAVGSPTAGKGNLNITDSEFETNTAKELGGAVFLAGAYPAAQADNYLITNIKRSAFINNSSNFGGGLFAWYFGASTGSCASSPRNCTNVENSTFTGNVANYYGGGLAAVDGADMTVNHSTIYNNVSGTDGGGIKARDANGNVVIKNSMVVGNLASTTINQGTVERPFTAISQAKYWITSGSGTAGIYNFNLAGNVFTTQVDANGYVLVASSSGAALSAGTGLTQNDQLTLQSDKILFPAILASLDITGIRISSPTSKSGNLDVTSTNATNITRLKANQTLGNNFDLGVAPWTQVPGSTNLSANMTGATCTDWGHTSAVLSDNVLGHCGNGTNGFHWQVYRGVETTTWVNQTAPHDNLNLWVWSNPATGLGNNIENNVAITATDYNLIGFNGASGWQNIATANQVPGGTSFVSAATVITQIIDTSLDYHSGLTRNFALSTNGGAGSSAFNKIPIASCIPAYDQRNAPRVSSGGFNKCDIGSYESTKTDTDGDGIVDAVDNCAAISNYGNPQLDTDTDNLGDSCDPDIDGDGVLNAADWYPTKSLGGRLDTDGDGIPNVCDAACASAGMSADTDADNDAVPNIADNCPEASNVDQNNIDGDSYGDACDVDLDGDGINNIADNCPSVSNPLQTDSDGNGLGNDCNAFFVKPVASGLADGSSWSNAYGGGTGTQLQNAIDSAYAKSASLMYLAKGVYRPSATVNLKKGMQIYGGFTGVDEIYHYQADAEKNLTIITGDTDNNDTRDSDGITQSYTHQAGTNLARIFSADTLGTAYGDVVTITGITLTAAGSNSAIYAKNARLRLSKVKLPGNKGASGGALFIDENAFAIISDSIFSANQSTNGGAAYIAGTVGKVSEVTFINTEFTANQATGAGSVGGALSVMAYAKATITNSSMTDNRSVDSGGAIHGSAFDTLYITTTIFSGNTTTTTAANLGGGAIRLSGGFTSAYIGSSDILNNTSASEGGALMVSSTSPAPSGLAKVVTVEDTLFKANSATGGSAVGGGAISVGNASGLTALTISRSSFISNTSVKGGAILLAGGDGNDMALDNSTFYDNRSSGNGAAINISSGADATVSYITLLQNIATGHGGGIRVEPVDTSSVLNIKTSLVIGNTSTASSGGSNISINYTGSGGYTDSGYNLIGYGAASGLYAANVNNATPALPSKKALATSIDAIITPALTDYSGVHKSIALTATSEARDVIPNGAPYGCVTDVGYDERGFERPDLIDVTDPEQKNDIRKCDIGAFEFNNAYRIDCFAEDGLRPDQGSGYGYYYCQDGTKPSAGELANNVFVGRVDYYLLLLMFMLGFARVKRQQIKV